MNKIKYSKLYLLLRYFWRIYIDIKNKFYFRKIDKNLTSPKFVQIIHKDLNFEIKVNPENGYYDKDLAYRKILDEDFAEYFLDNLKNGSVFIDVGANIGYFTLLCSRKVGDAGKIFSFEPILEICSQLMESVNRNNMKNIYAYNVALGREDSKLNMHILEDSTPTSSLFNVQEETNKSVYRQVEVKKFDEIWDETMNIDLIKIDVEGYEYEVLLGMENTLRKQSPVLIVEYSPKFYDKIDKNLKFKIISFLKEKGYSITLLDFAEKPIEILDAKDLEGSKYETGVWNIICKKLHNDTK